MKTVRYEKKKWAVQFPMGNFDYSGHDYNGGLTEELVKEAEAITTSAGHVVTDKHKTVVKEIEETGMLAIIFWVYADVAPEHRHQLKDTITRPDVNAIEIAVLDEPMAWRMKPND